MKYFHSAALACAARKCLLLAIIGTALLALPLSAQDLPAGKGRETFQTVCTACHGIEIVVSLRNTRGGWMEIIGSMRNNGAEGTEAQFGEIADYLALNFGRKEGGAVPKAEGSVQKAAPSSTPAPVPLRPVPWEKNRLKIGQAIYRENCVVCHDVDVEKSKKIGPSFFHLFQREKMPRSGVKPDRTYIAGKVRVGGPIMPAFAKKLSPEEIDALLDYIQSK